MFYTLLISIFLIILLSIILDKLGKQDDIVIFIPISLSITFILLLALKFCVDKYTDSEEEYRGYIITEAQYYERYETWVEDECSKTVPCGDNECTVYYDCSYCDEIPARYVAIDNVGNVIKINKNRYQYLLDKWSTTEKFYDLKRDIDYTFLCGKDGDMYYINWDNNILTSESYIERVRYVNKAKTKNSVFNYTPLDSNEKISNIVYEYPQYYEDDFYKKQSPILGLDRLNLSDNEKKEINQHYEYINGLGDITRCKLFILLYPNKPLSNSFIQERHWKNGHRNELNITIGYDSITKKIEWVRSFSWSDNKDIHVYIREDLSSFDTLDLMKMYPIILNNIKNHFEPKDIKDFDYIEKKYPTWCYVLSIFISIFTPIVNFLYIYIKEKPY